MRIIAGEHRGRLLKTPEGQGTRPMLDRVREAVFSSIGARVEDAAVLDLFAGTGSLGLEALSRGAASARLVERDPRVVRLLRENVSALGLSERAVCVGADALSRFAWREVGDEAMRYGLVFFDSPYPLLEIGKTRHAIFAALGLLAREYLADGGLIVFHAPSEKVQEPEFGAGLAVKLREYGTNAIWYLEKA